MSNREITIEKENLAFQNLHFWDLKKMVPKVVPGGAVVVSRLEHKLQEETTTFDAVFRILPWKCGLQFMFSVWDHFIMIGN